MCLKDTQPKIHHINYLSVQPPCIKCIHTAIQRISRTFSPCKTETLYPLNSYPFSSPLALGKWKVLVIQSCRTLCDPMDYSPHSVLSWTVVPSSMEFFRQEYRSGLPYPSPGDLPDAGSLLHFRQILYHLTHQGSPQILVTNILILPASMSLITLDSWCKWDCTVFIFLWLAYFLSIMFSKHIHVIAWDRIFVF